MAIVQYVSQVLLFVTLMQNFNSIDGERTRDKMYISIDGASCFRRLNGTHQTGCSSLLSGSVGVLHLIKTEIDFDFVLNNPPAPPYAPVLTPDLFTRTNVLRLKNEGGNYISAVLLLDKRDNMMQFSHELTCPNQYSRILDHSGKSLTTCDQHNLTDTWNPYGTGLLYEDFPFPIYYISNIEEMKKILNCFYDFNGFDYESHKHRSLCAIEVKSFMSAAVSSEVCRRRTNFVNNLGRTNYCDPLEGRNVYATLFPRAVKNQKRSEQNGTEINEKFILVSCRMDTTSMFDGVGLGASGSLVGYITLMSVAHTLANILPQNDKLPDKRQNVFFVIFDGESYDYIGSQRFVYDLENLALTAHSELSLKNIDLMIDIGTLDDISSLSLYSVKDFTQSKEFANKFNRYGSISTLGLKVHVEAATGPHIPPTSAQSFLRKNNSFPAIVINSKPLNRFYHSIYDDLRNINFSYMNTSSNFTALMENKAAGDYFPSDSIQMKIRNVSSVIALALYEMLTRATYTDNKIANPILIDELLHCFLESASCPLFKAASHPNSLPTLAIPPQRYISVSGSSQEASGWTYRLLGYILSQKQPRIKRENCTNLPLFWFSGYNGAGECRLTTQNYSHALSPAFLISDYTWSSGQYSTWTESTWMQISARIFLKPSRMQEIVTLSIGFVILLMSSLLVSVINRKSDVLFEDAPISSNM